MVRRAMGMGADAMKMILAMAVVMVVLLGTTASANSFTCGAEEPPTVGCGSGAEWSTLSFYLQITSGLFRAVMGEQVGGALSPYFKFGSVVMFDHPITEEATNASRELGRAQGMQITDSIDGSSVFDTFTITLNDGSGRISVEGREDNALTTRELLVVGGTGRYRLARGYVIANILMDEIPTYHVRVHLLLHPSSISSF